MIYQVRNEDTQEEEWFCSDANSTAYSALLSGLLLQHCPRQAEKPTCCPAEYPLADASVFASWQGKGPAVQSKLDGTVYSLETGGVLEWCPKNTLLRKILGRLAICMRHGPCRYLTFSGGGLRHNLTPCRHPENCSESSSPEGLPHNGRQWHHLLQICTRVLTCSVNFG